jgi:hypothetical protein
MEVLPLLLRLWRRRLALAAGALMAIALAVAIGPPPPRSHAVAWTRLVLDTPTSQLVKSSPSGADSLAWRASLLTHLMETDATQRQLAQRLGVRPDQVAVVDPVLAEPLVAASAPQKAADVAAVVGAPYVLTVSVTSSTLPMISIEAAAPKAAGAKRLADAAVDIFKAQAPSDGAYVSPIPTGEGVRKFQPFVVQDAAVLRVKTVLTSQVPVKTVGAPAALLLLWCAFVLLLPGGPRRRPRAAYAG